VIDVLLKNWKAMLSPTKALGIFHRRIGCKPSLLTLKKIPSPQTSLVKTFPADCVID